MIGLSAVLIGVLLVASGFLVRVLVEPDAEAGEDGDAVGSPTAVAANPDAVDFGLLQEILGVLQEDFVEQDRVDPELLHEGAIQGLFEALGDPHSTYIDPQTYAISRDDFSGTFQGIGATVSKQDEFIVILRPLPGTPAEQAGIQAGDVVLEVNGESAIDWTVEQAVLRIRGPQGTEVELKIRHPDGAEETLSIVRDEILVTSVRADPPGGVLRDSNGEVVTDLTYIWIRSFTRNTPQELEEMVTQAEEAGSRGLILDVRSNPGGLLAETTQIADMFLDDGTILVQVERDGTERTAEARMGQITELPVVILQDEFSASGAELLAAALQENGRAQVIGTQSFGKGTVNHVRELSNGGAVYVSIARWLTPARNQIEGRGITPDIPVEVTLEDIEAGDDIALFRAIDVLRGTGGAQAATPPVATAGAPGTP